MDSVLNTIKKLLGIPKEEEAFDQDLIVNINTVLSILFQMGVKPSVISYITTSDDKWEQVILNYSDMPFIVSYVHLKVKLLFDPPNSSAVSNSISSAITELEWRLNSCVNFKKQESGGDDDA